MLLKMPSNKVVLYGVVLLVSLITQTLCDVAVKHTEALTICLETTISFFTMYQSCVQTAMPSMKFASDDLKSFVNYPSRTTVGYAPKFTSNRKFFANMISTIEFKNTLQRDEDELRQDLIKKMKYCDTVVMDQDLLRDMYDREVDQTKMKK